MKLISSSTLIRPRKREVTYSSCSPLYSLYLLKMIYFCVHVSTGPSMGIRSTTSTTYPATKYPQILHNNLPHHSIFHVFEVVSSYNTS